MLNVFNGWNKGMGEVDCMLVNCFVKRFLFNYLVDVYKVKGLYIRDFYEVILSIILNFIWKIYLFI